MNFSPLCVIINHQNSIVIQLAAECAQCTWETFNMQLANRLQFLSGIMLQVCKTTRTDAHSGGYLHNRTMPSIRQISVLQSGFQSIIVVQHRLKKEMTARQGFTDHRENILSKCHHQLITKIKLLTYSYRYSCVHAYINLFEARESDTRGFSTIRSDPVVIKLCDSCA